MYDIQDGRIIRNEWRRKAYRPGANYIRILRQWDISPLDSDVNIRSFLPKSITMTTDDATPTEVCHFFRIPLGEYFAAILFSDVY